MQFDGFGDDDDGHIYDYYSDPYEDDWLTDFYSDHHTASYKPRKDLSSYTEAERTQIEAACRKAGKESPWQYRARLERDALAGKETPLQYTIRKIKEEDKLKEIKEQEEIPVPKKPSHKVVLNLQQQRQKAGMTQKQAAQIINERVKTIQDWESGRVKPSGPKYGKLKSTYKRKIAAKEKKGGKE